MAEIAARRTILITSFAGFPGTPRNPTERLVACLLRSKPRLGRLGIDLQAAHLPVVYAELSPILQKLAAAYRPDTILHFGVAARRRRVSVETRAINHANPLRPDAAGRRFGPRILRGAADAMRSTLPVQRMRSALVVGGVSTELSRDAGSYVCNAALFLSLHRELAAEVGFVHIPQPRPNRPLTRQQRLLGRTALPYGTTNVQTTRKPSLEELESACTRLLLVLCVCP